MAFSIGGLTSGLSSGLRQGMKMGTDARDAKAQDDLVSSLTGMMHANPDPNSGANSGQATAAVQTGSPSDATVPASTGSAPDLTADPRSTSPTAAPDAAMSAPTPGTRPTAASGAAMSAPGKVFGASVSDWVHTPAPSYLPQGQGPTGDTPMPVSQSGQSAVVGVRPPMLSGAPTLGSSSLANQQSPMGQAIQMQYGNGGM